MTLGHDGCSTIMAYLSPLFAAYTYITKSFRTAFINCPSHYRLPDATGPVLEVPNTVLEDAGVYQCFITNSAGFDSSAALVDVQSEWVYTVCTCCIVYKGITEVCLDTGML